MTESIHDLAAAYALNALPDDERAAFEEHLDECAECSAEVAGLLEAASALAEVQTPPPGLRARVLDGITQVEQDRPPSRIAYRVLAVAAALLILAVIVITIWPEAELAPADVIASPDAVTTAIPVTDDGPVDARGELVVSSDLAAAVARFTGLENPGAALTYEIWVIGDEGPVPAGLFVPDAAGSAEVLLDAPVESGALIGLTIEPEGGSTAPTGAILFLGMVEA